MTKTRDLANLGSGFTQAGTGAVQRTVESKLKDVVSVKDFGAVGDGVTDDTAAIQAAIAAAYVPPSNFPGLNKGCIYFPPGEYRITSTVDAQSVGAIYGSSSSQVIILYEGNDTTIQVSAVAEVRDLAFKGVSGTGLVGLTYPNIAYLSVVENCSFFNFSTGINVANVGNTTTYNQFTNNIFQSCSVGIKMPETVTTTRIKNNQFNTGVAGIEVGNNFNCEISGNVFEDLEIGIKVNAQLAYSLISNNWFERTGASAYSNIIAYQDNTASPGYFLNNTFAGNRYVNEATPRQYGTSSVIIENGAVELTNDNKAAGAPGITYGLTSCTPSILTASPYTAPVDYSFSTQSADATLTARGADLRLNMGAGSNGQRAGAVWGRTGNNTPFAIYGAASTNAAGGSDQGVIIGSTSYYWGLTEDITFLNSYIAVGGDFSGAGNGYATGTVSIYSGGKFNGDVQVTSPSITCKFGDLSVYPGVDNTTTLGISSLRWSVVYAGTGTINTSDEREKQDIEELSAAELRTATALKSLVKKFRFKDAVQAKGSDARIHVGVLAQDVIAAFQAEGLDPMRYGIVCYDQWDATDDAPAGDRYGIRYEELLAFIIAAL